jgi:membrane-associated phospholipid phosphatase
LILVFYLSGFPISVTLNTLNFLIMMLLMGLANLKIKASLHACIAFYISISFFSLSAFWGIPIFVLAIATAWSRLILGRHTVRELIVGSVIGLFFGLLSLFL